jgi:hypothetical protein
MVDFSIGKIHVIKMGFQLGMQFWKHARILDPGVGNSSFSLKRD